MATNGETELEDNEMADHDDEKVVTMMDVLKEQQDFEEDANAVLGASDEKNCTYPMGYIKRQAIYACMTCCADAKDDPAKRAGVCLACSLKCHEDHELIELYTKRNFRCDCGNPKFNSHPCQFTPNKIDLNEENSYNQNFSGLYCVCHRPYPDPEAIEEDVMIQCTICEDWLHCAHLDATVPSNNQYSEMICKSCMERNVFLNNYSGLVVNIDDIVEIENIQSLCNDAIHQSVSIEPKNDEEPPNHIDVEMIPERDQNNAQSPPKLENSEEMSNSTRDSPQQDEDAKLCVLESTVSMSDMNQTLGGTTENNCIVDTPQDEPKSDTDALSFNEDKVEEARSAIDDTTKISELPENEAGENKISHEEKRTTEDSSITDKEENTKNSIGKEENKDIETDMLNEKETELLSENTSNNILNEEVYDKTETNADTISKSLNENIDLPNVNQTVDSLQENIVMSNEPKEAVTNEILNDATIATQPIAQNKNEDLQQQFKAISIQNKNIAEPQIEENGNIREEGVQEKIEEDKLLEDPGDIEENFNSEIGDDSSSKALSGTSEPVIDKTISENREECPVTEETQQPLESENIKTTDEIIDEKMDNNEPEHSTKRKSPEDPDNNLKPKKQKIDAEPCNKPKDVKGKYRGATFWPDHFRQKLCTCNDCLAMYKDLSVLFLLDPEDTVAAYENLGKEKTNGKPASEYEKGLAALSSLDRIQQINALTEYNKMRDKLLDFLKSFKDRKAVVKEEDIKAFFAGIKPTREPDGVYFCK